MNDHPTGGKYGDGATDRLRDLTQRQNRQRDSRERPTICSTAWLRVREKKPDMKVRFPLLHHQGNLGMILSWGGSAKRRFAFGGKRKERTE